MAFPRSGGLSQIREAPRRPLSASVESQCLQLRIIFIPTSGFRVGLHVLVFIVPVFIVPVVCAGPGLSPEHHKPCSSCCSGMAHQCCRAQRTISPSLLLTHLSSSYCLYLFVFAESSFTGAQNSGAPLIRAACGMSLGLALTFCFDFLAHLTPFLPILFCRVGSCWFFILPSKVVAIPHCLFSWNYISCHSRVSVSFSTSSAEQHPLFFPDHPLLFLICVCQKHGPCHPCPSLSVTVSPLEPYLGLPLVQIRQGLPSEHPWRSVAFLWNPPQAVWL